MARLLQRERERERERDLLTLHITRTRARVSKNFSKLLYRRYIVSYDIAVFLLSEPGFTGLKDVHDFAMRRKNPVRDDRSVEKDNSKFKIMEPESISKTGQDLQSL
jgi:hypothetical protein